MRTNTRTSTGCCEPFDVPLWDKKTIIWKDKMFVKDHITSFLHIPLNMGQKITKNIESIKEANAAPKGQLMLFDETSLWGADIYIAVTKTVQRATMAALSGTFITKVFEGPYQNVGSWAQDMKRYVEGKKKKLKKMFFYYTTCPACQKAYGKNYVVLFAQV